MQTQKNQRLQAVCSGQGGWLAEARVTQGGFAVAPPHPRQDSRPSTLFFSLAGYQRCRYCAEGVDCSRRLLQNQSRAAGLNAVVSMMKPKSAVLIVIAMLFVVTEIASAQTSSPAAAVRSPTQTAVDTVHPRRPTQRQVRVIRQNTRGPTMSYSTALQRQRHEHHTRFWWRQRYPVIVLVGGGYYYLNAGYWYPAWGYDPNYSAYDYDGPIYTYGNLLPDQVILNVQRALTDLGYYRGALSGSLSAATRYAITAYQQDNGLPINGVVDASLVDALGLE
jgi:hypothetical protein